MLYVLFCLFIMFPVQANAAVYISEVAWMGSSESANYEWVELHNDGSAQDISGWSLGDSMNLSIELEGIVPANSYVVLERTSDSSAQGAAFLIYTGALVNTGATLRLTRSDESLVDQVAGGEDWVNIGGDNTTKETAQYTSSGWMTAVATPGEDIVWADTVGVAPEDSYTESVVSKSSSEGDSLILIEPDITLDLKISAQSTGYVHQPLSFGVTASGIGKSLINSLRYQWNFGDGFGSSDKDVVHMFEYPGTYVVTVYGGFKRQEQVSRHEITILPVRTSLTTNSEGDIQVNNDSPYELNISGYRLKGQEVVVFSDYSILLPNQTITISKERLGKTEGRMVALYDTESVIISSIIPDNFQMESTFENLRPEVQISSFYNPNEITVPSAPDFIFSENESVQNNEEGDKLQKSQKIPQSAFVAQTVDVVTTDETNSHLSYLLLLGVIVLGIVGLYATPKRNEIA